MASKNTSSKQAEILGDAEFNKKWENEAQYQFLRKSNDPRFGEIGLYKNKSTNDLIFAKEKMVTSKQQASNDIRDLKSRIALNHNNLHKLTGYSTAIQKELCSTNYLTKAYYEFPKSDLQKEINDRRNTGGKFTGDELMNIANQSINGLNHLHKLDISHGDIRPLNIGYNKDSKNVQILDRLADPSPLEKLQSNNIINKKDLYVSPEVYKKLQGKDKTLKYNPYKNDLYGLGLSLLHAGNLEGVQNIYKANGDVDQAALNAQLSNFDGQYAGSHPQLSNLVHTLVNADENSRWTSQQFVDGFSSGQFAGGPRAQASAQVYAEPPSLFSNFETTTTSTVQSQPIETTTHTQTVQKVAAPVNVVHTENVTYHEAFAGHAPAQQKEETTVLYNADDQAATIKNADNFTFENQGYSYNNLAPPKVNYIQSAPTTTTTYTSSAPTTTTYTSSAPTTTYTYNNSTPTTTYTSSVPTTTNYVSSIPTTYTSSAPTTTYYTNAPTTYVNSAPSQTVTYSSAPIEVISSNPVTTYTTAPTTTYTTAPTTTYTTSAPTTYTTYTSAPTETVVHSAPTYISNSQTILAGSNQATTGVTTVTVQRMDGTTYTYTVDEKDHNNIQHDYERHDPRNGGDVAKSVKSSFSYASPETRIETIQPSNVVYTAPTTHTYTTIDSSPIYSNTKVYAAPAENYVTYSTPTTTTYKSSSIFVNSNETLLAAKPATIVQAAPTTYTNYTYSAPSNELHYVQNTAQINPGIEVRRGSSIPIAVQDQAIRKKYVIEGDKVIEVDEE
jgi:serine/threonine protein kinase